jgi:hypothetical protein
MHLPFHARAACGRTRAALALAPLCLASLGCAGPAWADYETKRAVDAAAADDSFPSADEVGLAADSGTPAAAER